MAVATLIPDHQRVLDDLRELYCCRPTKEIIDRLFRKDVEFEDPLAKCHGIGELAAQWYTMTKMFSKSETLSFRLMASTASPNQVVFWQQQAYTFRLLNKTKTIESVVTADLDEDGKITRLTDQWNGGELPTFFGSTLLRTVNAKIVPWLVHVPKD
ncbi:hypothetical protein BKA70DRAFT_1248725 [Coprinopsis sp. MPI-PUGE-AT-0042]|nr:hypothetical protein BKA70DRAFT_1248725 [Coprinopsis sp. MPI-PUGE-AT-0042]